MWRGFLVAGLVLISAGRAEAFLLDVFPTSYFAPPVTTIEVFGSLLHEDRDGTNPAPLTPEVFSKFSLFPHFGFPERSLIGSYVFVPDEAFATLSLDVGQSYDGRLGTLVPLHHMPDGTYEAFLGFTAFVDRVGRPFDDAPFSVTIIPEVGSWLLFGLGLVGWRWRFRI